MATLALELPLLVAGLWMYASATRATDHIGWRALTALTAFLLLIYAANLFGPLPEQERDRMGQGRAQWLVIAWVYWVDAHRARAGLG